MYSNGYLSISFMNVEFHMNTLLDEQLTWQLEIIISNNSLRCVFGGSGRQVFIYIRNLYFKKTLWEEIPIRHV